MYCRIKLSHNSLFRHVILLSGENVLAYPQTYFYPSTQSTIALCGGALCVIESGDNMNNIQKNINKVLLALRTKGIVYKINSKQFYSSEQKRIRTKYILFEFSEWEDGELFYSKKELLLYLVEKWKEVNGGDSGGSQSKPE